MPRGEAETTPHLTRTHLSQHRQAAPPRGPLTHRLPAAARAVKATRSADHVTSQIIGWFALVAERHGTIQTGQAGRTGQDGTGQDDTDRS